MSEIYGGEVSSSEASSGSGEVSGDSSASSGSEINTGEVSEVENTSEVTEGEVDDEFSSELDDSYSSYMENGKISDFKKEGSYETEERAETSETEVAGESDESFEQELDSKYSDYLNGEHTSEGLREGDNRIEAAEDMEEDSDDIDSELDKKYNAYIDEGGKDVENMESKQGELSDAGRAELKEETGWSDEVVDSVDTYEQAKIYENADLHEDNINGRECLVKEIDYDYVDEKTGMTNRELMAKGRSPYDAKTGEKIELHHMGQAYDAPFAELTENSEHGDGNHSILHPKTDSSWRNDETLEAQYNKEKREHWKTRSEG